MRNSRVSTRRLGILLVGALLLAPGLGWAVEEDIKESDAKAAAGKKDEKKSPETAEAAKTAESGKAAPSIDFNTLEDIVAFRGSFASLWAGQPVAPEDAPIAWREIVPSEQPAPAPAPLSSTTVR